jgi:hypothetical protein
VPYRPTGNSPGRPRKPRCPAILDLHRKADGLDKWSTQTRAKAAGLIAEALASGMTKAELAAELAWTTTGVARALRGRSVRPQDRINEQEQEQQ